MKVHARFTFLYFLILPVFHIAAQDSYVLFEKRPGTFALSEGGKSAPLLVDSDDYVGVLKAARDLQQDIERVTGTRPELYPDTILSDNEVLIVGTLGKSALIDRLIQAGKLDVKDVEGKWETFVVQVIEQPMADVARALVIAGSDKRGTIYGIYDLSKQIGVSPWYWWADVPPKRSNGLYVFPGRYMQGEPKVKYRGIFINDEEPALGRWVVENYGGFTHQFYEKVFELILRLKGNYLWPAMWWASFYSDDPLNPKLADDYGVVIGTTHHEPMMRAHAEWKTFKGGEWNYETNAETLRRFWTEGIQRMGDFESIVSLGMRGDGDLAMTEETNIALLQRIVADQREIITDVTGRDLQEIPQLWALYKEVQDYYDKGMRVPDDVTLLLCDDNWGNIRRLPNPRDKPRTGGYGIYYHFDYVGGPRNYKWVNTNQLARIWEQMHLAYVYGANRIWLVNVGDIKPMELPTEFFLDYAWNPEVWDHTNLRSYTRQWAQRQFGEMYAHEIARILTAYTTFNARRKPELLGPDTYSIIHYREAEKIVEEYNALLKDARKINEQLPAEYRDAFYQLVLHPVEACANLNELYVTVAKNRLYAHQKRSTANARADRARELFMKDSLITHYYNKVMAGGKWNHMMDQTHIGYTHWQQPEKNVMPEVIKMVVPEKASMGIAIEGSESCWPDSLEEAVLPESDRYHRQVRFIEIFNRGKQPLSYAVQASVNWIKLSNKRGKIIGEERILVEVNWQQVPAGKHKVPITITGSDNSHVVVYARVNNTPLPEPLQGFVESDGCISIEAEHFSRKVDSQEIRWGVIPDLGRTLSGVTAFPVTAPSGMPDKDSPRLEYILNVSDTGAVNIHAYLSPTLDFLNRGGLRYAISLDDEPPVIMNMHADPSTKAWGKTVSDNINIVTSRQYISKPGRHVLKFWRIDPGVVLQKLVVDRGGMRPSYLGPPESYFSQVESKSNKK